MSEHSAEKDAATLTDKEIELREWLRSQPGGAERWTVVKAGFRRSYDMGARDALREAADAVPWTGAVTPKWLRDRAARVLPPGSDPA